MDKGVKFLAELLVGFYLARYLGAEQFGLFNFAVSFVILFQGLSTLGLNEILVRELMSHHQHQGSILSTALFLRILTALILIILSQIFAISFDYHVRFIILIISISLLFRSFEVFTPFFQSIIKAEWVAFIQIIVTVIGAGAKILGVFLNADLIWFAWIYSMEWLILGFGLFVTYLRTNRHWSWTFEKAWSSKLIRSAWYLMLSAAAVNLYMRLDQVMIRQMLSDTANGHYSAAVRLSEIWYICPTILCAILFPAILNARSSDRKKYDQRLKYLNSFLFWTALALAAIVSPFSNTLIVWLYGAEYLPGGVILSYHIWTAIFVFFGVSSGYWLIAEKLEKISLYRTVAGLAINLVLNFILIPMLGTIGAAIATLAGQMMASIILMLLLQETRPIIKIQFASIILPFQLAILFLRKRSYI